MENFIEESNSKKRILLCSNLDNDSVAKLSERFVSRSPELDAIVAFGPFSCNSEINSSSKEEEDAAKIADIGSMVALLENIVCRVVYLPAQKDPNPIIIEDPHLTPNSVTLHGRKLMLLKNLFISGYSEPDLTADANDFANDEEGNMGALEEIRIQTAKSMDVLRDIIRLDLSLPDQPVTGIFALLYHFSHTLNHFLFHLNDELESAGIDVCIICSANSDELSRLPKKFGNITIVTPGNLQQGNYTIMDLEFCTLTKKWKPTSVEYATL